MNKKERRKMIARKVRVAWRSRDHLQQRPHGLHSRLIVNLTSHPSRFPTLPLTLKCLLSQSVRADRIILWIAESDMAALPNSVRAFAKFGLTIRPCEDFLSYNKIVHAVRDFPNDFLVVADDDVYYPRDWLAGLVKAYDPASWEVLCHRARIIGRDENDAIAPYGDWQCKAHRTVGSPMIFPTAGVGGALYRPGILHKDITRSDIFMEHARTTDDIWLYLMTRMNGAVCRKVPGFKPVVTWLGSQRTNLVRINNQGGGNDRCWKSLCDHYGVDPINLPVGGVPLKQRMTASFRKLRNLCGLDGLAKRLARIRRRLRS